MRNKSTPFENIDWILVGLFLALMFLGWINIYAATYNEEHQSILSLSQPYGKQLLWIILGLVIGALIMMIDTGFFKTFAFVIYGITNFLLLLVLIIGSEIKGSQSWIVIGGMSLQPAEFAKFGTALALSAFLADGNKKFIGFSRRVKAFLILGLPCLLIMGQPDLGSTLVYASFIFVFYREGLSGNILLLIVYLAVLGILSLLLNNTFLDLPFQIQAPGKSVLVFVLAMLAFAFYRVFKKVKQIKLLLGLALGISVGIIFTVDYAFDNVLKPHQQNRINDLLGITSDPTGAGYNVNQSKIAIGSGGLFGKGFLEGTQTKFDFVPEQSTDFIFCTVGEEWGFVGSLVVICLFVVLLFRILIIAERQRSNFTRIYAYSVASIFFIHFSINIAMTIGLAPVIGIPLPFFSYGGSSLWGFTLLLITLVKLDAERKFVLR